MRRSGGLRWIVGAALAMLASTAIDARALDVCEAQEVFAEDPGCPEGDGPCTITLPLVVLDSPGCGLDFGERDVRVQKTIDSTGRVSLTTGPLIIDPGARIRGSSISITAAGDVTVARTAGAVPGLLELVNLDEYDQAVLQVSTPGHFLLEGRIDADAAGVELSAGNIEIEAKAGITTGPFSVISANAPLQDQWLGMLVLNTDGPIDLQGVVNLRGPDEGDDQFGGEIDIQGGGSFRLAPGAVLRAGTIYVDVEGDARIERESASRRALIEADEAGSLISIAAGGAMLVAGEVSTNGSTCDYFNFLGVYGRASLTVTADALLSASGVPDPEYDDVCSAYVDIDSEGQLLFEGTLIQLGGGDPEGDGRIDGGDVVVKGRIRMDGWYKQAQGGSLVISGETVVVDSEITTVAGPATLGDEYGSYSGNVFIYGSDLTVGGSIVADGTLYGSAGLIDIDGANVNITGTLSARAHRLYEDPGRVHITANSGALDFTGSIDIGNGGGLAMHGDPLNIGGRIVGHTQAGTERPWYIDERPQVVIGYGCGYGTANLSGVIDLSAFGCEAGSCAVPWDVRISGDEVTLTPSAVIENTGREGGKVTIRGEHLALAGRLDVSGSETDGRVEVGLCAFDEPTSCTITAEIEPPASFQNGCLPATPTPVVSPSSTPTPTPSPYPSSTVGPINCPGDCDNDRVVESTDLMIVLSLVNSCGGSVGGCSQVAASCAAADLDDSGILSAREVSRVVGVMGTHCGP